MTKLVKASMDIFYLKHYKPSVMSPTWWFIGAHATNLVFTNWGGGGWGMSIGL
ncbi:MAG: hypothetical protein ACLQO6_15000 [Desulfomonilaceae bacterium]